MRTLDPIHPSAAIRASYEKWLDALVEAMHRDVTRTLMRTYRDNPPRALVLYAADASPANTMRGALGKLDRKWQRRFDDGAQQRATKFAKNTKAYVDRRLRADAAKARMGVQFKMTRGMRDAYDAVCAENVSLITNIPEQYFTQVESLVMQSVSAGRDLEVLATGLRERLGITKRRAALIARDQNGKASAVMARARYLDMGITKAVWLHSAGGKIPRPPHVKFSGKTYDIATGQDFEDGEGHVHPGQLINCRCVPKPVIEGFEE